MSSVEPADAWRLTLRRWLHENVADTRAPDGPAGRVYTAPFARVWDEILAQVASRRRWSLVHQDEELGIISVTCRWPLFRRVDDLTVWVALDDNALTRVDARSRARAERGDLGANRRRIEGLLQALDRAVGPETRLREGRTQQRAAAGSTS